MKPEQLLKLIRLLDGYEGQRICVEISPFAPSRMGQQYEVSIRDAADNHLIMEEAI